MEKIVLTAPCHTIALIRDGGLSSKITCFAPSYYANDVLEKNLLSNFKPPCILGAK